MKQLRGKSVCLTVHNFGNNRTDIKYLLFPYLSFIFEEQKDIFTLNATVKKFVAGMTRRFVSAKRHVRYFRRASRLRDTSDTFVEHRALSPVRQVKMLAGWPFTDYHLFCSTTSTTIQSLPISENIKSTPIFCKNQTPWEIKIFNPPLNFACS